MIGKINEIFKSNVSDLFYFSPLLQPLLRIHAFWHFFLLAFGGRTASFDFDSLFRAVDGYTTTTRKSVQ